MYSLRYFIVNSDVEDKSIIKKYSKITSDSNLLFPVHFLLWQNQIDSVFFLGIYLQVQVLL